MNKLLPIVLTIILTLYQHEITKNRINNNFIDNIKRLNKEMKKYSVMEEKSKT